jgi:hypothetical protein
MKTCNYVPLETPYLDTYHPISEDLLDLDVLCTEEGIFVNVPEKE